MTMRIALATTYLEARVEYAVAGRAGRPSRIGLDELARLGVEAFGSGADGDALQLAVDTLANHTAQIAGTSPSERSSASAVGVDLEVDRGLLDAGLEPALLRSFRGLAEAAAMALVKRDAETGTRSDETPDVRELVKREVAAFHRTMHRGVWQATEQYEQGQMVTSNGSMWSCQRACSGEHTRPGTADSWLLVVKRGADGRSR